MQISHISSEKVLFFNERWNERLHIKSTWHVFVGEFFSFLSSIKTALVFPSSNARDMEVIKFQL